ncbi:tetratricopeptide repeat protein [Terricaulis silvestris]|uniref:Photosystem I assembly protein Ycf3 n=1 Tax=Terricaulis silvestris TaxID=2686094 RepID=A0A6I6MMH8_9CAUL|nr:tetratricopeptide repeat protein [Terricaulis silvestris]QGZ95889.1 photosystem I assembly protein Ycf3 [Terricaulis silvestris]
MKLTQFVFAVAALGVAGAAPVAMADGGGGGMGPSTGSSGGGTNASRPDPAAAYQAGVAALQAQNYRDAIRSFREARRSAPNDSQINFALGLAYVGAGENDDARGALERAVRDENGPPGAWLQLGLTYIELGRRDDAVAQQAALAAKVAACDTACGDQRRAQLQLAHDQLTQALAAPAAADPATTGWNFPSVEEGRAAYAEAVGLINQDRFADAFTALQRAKAAVGPHPDVLNYMGFVSRKLGRFDDSLGYYTAALRIDPDHIGATEYLGELYIQMGQLDRAERQLARLDELCAYGCEQREELARWIEASGR